MSRTAAAQLIPRVTRSAIHHHPLLFFRRPAASSFSPRSAVTKPFSSVPARFSSSQQQQPPTPQTHPTYFAPEPPRPSTRNFYRTHGRALFKALTLAFFTYQVLYWAWLTLETEEIKHGMNEEIKGLEGEVRRLDEERRGDGNIILEEKS